MTEEEIKKAMYETRLKYEMNNLKDREKLRNKYINEMKILKKELAIIKVMDLDKAEKELNKKNNR